MDSSSRALQVQHLVDRINGEFGAGSVIHEERDQAYCQLKRRLTLLSVADVFVVTTVRDGLNRWPLEYVLAQSYMGGQGSEYLPKPHAPGLMILSEFTSACRVLNGALHVNPWKVARAAAPLQTLLKIYQAPQIFFFKNHVCFCMGLCLPPSVLARASAPGQFFVYHPVHRTYLKEKPSPWCAPAPAAAAARAPAVCMASPPERR